MYENGELDMVMAHFEKNIQSMPVYVGGSTDRADMHEVAKVNGTTSRRYKNQNYYNNGNVNQLFIAYLHGYSLGKCEGGLL